MQYLIGLVVLIFLVGVIYTFIQKFWIYIVGALIILVLVCIVIEALKSKKGNPGKGSSTKLKTKTVYYTMNGKCYHYSKACVHSDDVMSCDETSAMGFGLNPCPKCCKKVR